ncbi:MAG TPA: hypothetical protein VF308_03020 [Caldimonas sp.]
MKPNRILGQYTLIACALAATAGVYLPAVAQSNAQFALSRLNRVALNPQPLPPRVAQLAVAAPLSGAQQRGIIIVGGRNAGRAAPSRALPGFGQKVAP